jgi:TatA/E family protein of Tat protein translocase
VLQTVIERFIFPKREIPIQVSAAKNNSIDHSSNSVTFASIMILLFLNIGGGEMVLILMVVLLFFGSKNIPNLARGLGKGLREFKDATEGIKREIEQSANTIEEETKDVNRKLND